MSDLFQVDLPAPVESVGNADYFQSKLQTLSVRRRGALYPSQPKGHPIQFIRKFTLLDRYVLDLANDPQRTFDRRVALALGVMLDTGERR